MATPQYMPISRSMKAIFLGERTLAQPAYNPATAQQFQQGQIVKTNLGLLGKAANSKGTNILGNPLAAKVPELSFGWAPKIGHITTSAATSKRRKTVNPLQAAPTTTTSRKVNPFLTEKIPSADLFGLNLPV